MATLVARLGVAWAVLRGRPCYVVVTPDLASARAFTTSAGAQRWSRAGGVRFWNASQTVTCTVGTDRAGGPRRGLRGGA